MVTFESDVRSDSLRVWADGCDDGDSHSGVVGWCPPLSAIECRLPLGKVESDNQAKLCSRVGSRTLDVMTPSPRHGNRRRPAPLRGAKVSVRSRTLTERAIDVMRKSVAEPRPDGKASPLVGVVLWKPDGTVETACRGELRDGDHAEYTLLERKNRDSRLDGAVLFATLEPCAPGSRRHPKLGCAERIVLARIKEVWIGIEDPDPTVDRKGIEFPSGQRRCGPHVRSGDSGNDQEP